MKRQIRPLLFLYAAAGFFWTASASTPQEIESLINQLNDESGEVASQKLIRIGKAAVPQLLKALPAAARPLRYEIVDIFASMKSDAEGAVPALVAELKRSNIEGLSYATYHYKVAVALAGIGPSAVAGLTDTLSDANHNARQYAAFALSYMGSEAHTSVPASTPQEIESLVNQLNDESGEVIHNASENLIRIGKPAVPQLARALPAATGPLRYKIVDIFASMNSDAEEAVPALVAELRGPNIASLSYGNYHYEVAMALASIGPSALTGLTEGLNDPNHNARRYTADALGWLGMEARAYAFALMPLLRDEHDEVRASAASALASMGQVGPDTQFKLDCQYLPLPDALTRGDHPAHAAVSRLIQLLLADKSDSVRTTAAVALGAIADPTAVPALIAALDDKNDDVRTGAAAVALGEIGAPAKAAVPQLIHRSRIVKIVMNNELESIIQGLGGIGTPDVLPLLTEALKDSSALIRLTAVNALGEIADPTAIPALIAALADKDDDVRTGAAVALGEIADPTAVPALIAALADKDDDVRGAAAAALGEIGAPAKAAVPVLANLLKQATCNEYSLIIQGLGGIGTPDVVPVLTQALNDETINIHLRQMAEVELQKLKGDK